MLVPGTNPWNKAGGFDIQRTDLWVLDLTAVLNGVQKNSAFKNWIFPEPNKLSVFVQSVSFPEHRIGEDQSKVVSNVYSAPGVDEIFGSIRVDFLIESASVTSDLQLNNPGMTRSRIYNLIYAWMLLGRIGRTPRMLSEPFIPLPSKTGNTIPSEEGDFSTTFSRFFRFDLPINFLRGQITNDPDDDSTSQLETSLAFVIRNAWVSSIQFSNPADYRRSEPLILTAALGSRGIEPYTEPLPVPPANFALNQSGNIGAFSGLA